MSRRTEPGPAAGVAARSWRVHVRDGEAILGLRLAARPLHRRAAEWYERQGTGAEPPPELAALLALHWERAEEWTRADLWADRGVCAEVVEGSERAIESFDRALALDPEAVTAWYNRGVSLLYLDRHEEALAALDEVVALHRARELAPDADLVHAHHNMALCLLQLGRLLGAR